MIISSPVGFRFATEHRRSMTVGLWRAPSSVYLGCQSPRSLDYFSPLSIDLIYSRIHEELAEKLWWLGFAAHTTLPTIPLFPTATLTLFYPCTYSSPVCHYALVYDTVIWQRTDAKSTRRQLASLRRSRPCVKKKKEIWLFFLRYYGNLLRLFHLVVSFLLIVVARARHGFCLDCRASWTALS